MQRTEANSLLDQFRLAYEIKQAETDEKKRTEKHRQMMSLFRDRRDSLDQIRQEVASLGDEKSKLAQFYYLDDIIVFPMIIDLMNRLKRIHLMMIKTRLRKEISSIDPTEQLEADYPNALKAIPDRFSEWLNKCDELDNESIFNFVNSQIKDICENLADDLLSSETWQRVCSDVIRTDVILMCLLDIFSRADQRHMTALEGTLAPNTWKGYFKSGTSYYSLFKDVNEAELHKPFVAISPLIACIKQVVGTRALWPELKMWMEAVHVYHANLLRIKLDKHKIDYTIDPQTGLILLPEGKDYPPINNTDKIMYGFTKMTFYHLALHILKASETLGQVLAGKLRNVHRLFEESHAETDSNTRPASEPVTEMPITASRQSGDLTLRNQ